MKLMTKEIENALSKQKGGLYAQDGLGMKSKIIVKYFNPCGRGTWLITAGEKQADGDWLLFGYVELLVGEWGYVTLSELENIVIPPFGMKIERDITIKPNKRTIYEELKYLGRID